MFTRLLMLMMFFALAMPISFAADGPDETVQTESPDGSTDGKGKGKGGSEEAEPDCE